MGLYLVRFSGSRDVESLLQRMQQYREENDAVAQDQPEVRFVNKRWSGQMKVVQAADPVGIGMDWQRLEEPAPAE